MSTLGPQQTVYPSLGPTLPESSAPAMRLHSNDQAISKIEVKEGFFTRMANAIKNMFSVQRINENKAKIEVKEAKKIQKHKVTTTAQERLTNHNSIIKHLEKANQYTHMHWKIDFKIAQEYHSVGKYQDALNKLLQIPFNKYTNEMLYFKAVALKENGNFLEAHDIYEQLIAEKRPPENMTKLGLIEELGEMVEKWTEKPNITDKELAILKDYYPDVPEVVLKEKAPQVPVTTHEYFIMDRIPDANPQSNSPSSMYLKQYAKEMGTLEAVKYALKISSPPERWKWHLRLAKEYDLMARKPDITEAQRQEYHQFALHNFNALISDRIGNLMSGHYDSPYVQEILHIKVNLLWKTGQLDEALKLYDWIKPRIKISSPLSREILLEQAQLNHQIKMRDHNIERETQLKDRPLVEQLNGNKKIAFFLEENKMDLKEFTDFLKRNSSAITHLNLDQLNDTQQMLPGWIELCPNLTHLVAKNETTSTPIVQAIQNGKLSNLEVLVLSGLSSYRLGRLGAHFHRLTHLKSLDLSKQFAPVHFFRHLQKISPNLEVLNLSTTGFFPTNISSKFPNLKNLNLSKISDAYVDALFKNFLTELKESNSLITLDLSDTIRDDKHLEQLAENLWKFPNLESLYLNCDTSNITNKGLTRLLEKIKSLPKLKTLTLPSLKKGEKNISNLEIGSHLNQLKLSNVAEGFKLSNEQQQNLEKLDLSFETEASFETFFRNMDGIEKLTAFNIKIVNPSNETKLKNILAQNIHKFPVLKEVSVSYFEKDPAKRVNLQWKDEIEQFRNIQETMMKNFAQLNKNKPVVDFLKEQKMTLVEFHKMIRDYAEVAKQKGQEIKRLNFEGFSQPYELSWADKTEIYNLIKSLSNLIQISARNSFDVEEIVMELISEGQLTQIELLDLSMNEIGNIEIKALSKNLNKLTQLKELNLSNNEIGDAGMVALADKLKLLPVFEAIDLRNNKYTETGRKAMADFLEEETSPKKEKIKLKQD